MKPEQALQLIAKTLQNPKYVNLPYTEGAVINNCMAVLQTALKELEDLKKEDE